MQKSEKFFIFSWKELLVIGLLVLTLIGFFFTLGLHYGKKLHPELAVADVSAAKLEESPENIPPKDALDKGVQTTEPAAQDALKAATEAAVADAKLKVDAPKPVEFPKEKGEEPKAAVAGRETHDAGVLEPKFAVQLGSYTSKKEAQQKLGVLGKRGLKPEIRTAEVNNETRYRVVLPGFKSRQLAELRGKELKMKRKIENFVVIKAD
jgi:cell division protein FtsN